MEKRRLEYGANELTVHDDEPLWQKYLGNFKVSERVHELPSLRLWI